MSKLSVTLRLYYGQVTYDVNQKVTSKNEPITIQHGTVEWVNFLKHLKANGITKVDVEKIYDLDKVNKDEPVESLERYKEVEDEKIQKEVDEYLQAPVKELTPEQKQIKALQDQINELTAANTAKAPKTPPAGNKDAANTAK
ncbi:hypothetical protein [Chryseobacterium proteolyticum]|uniref:hypothetical protein n=1 Tax=Chryseobacterium proteolyticum TaxID=118127 RepID=UPI003983A5D5